jgi:Tfp pilus assembly protein PilN
MEITLNLLPPHLLRRRAETRRRQARALVALAAVIPVILAYAVIHARIQMLRFQSQVMERQVLALTPLAEKARKLDADLALARERRDALNRLAARLPRWSAVLLDLSALVPPDAWLTSLTIDGGRLAIVGQALDEGTVSTLTARLSAARFLTGTSLKYVRESMLGSRPVYTFEIDATVRTEGQMP